MCQGKLNRLRQIIKERENWQESLEEVRSMREWVLGAEALLDRSWVEQHEPVLSTSSALSNEQPISHAAPSLTNEQVGCQFDRWLAE